MNKVNFSVVGNNNNQGFVKVNVLVKHYKITSKYSSDGYGKECCFSKKFQRYPSCFRA